jgi:hypothetical protein
MNTAKVLFWCAGVVSLALGATPAWAADVIVSTRGQAAPVDFALGKLICTSAHVAAHCVTGCVTNRPARK